MSCNKYPLIKIVTNIGGGSGQRGPVGPQGPQGPPGTVDLPLESMDVDYRGTDLQTVLDELLYEEVEITKFQLTPNIAEIGSTVNNITVDWEYNKAIVEQSLTGPNTDLSFSISTRQALLTDLGITTTQEFTLTVDDGSTTKTSKARINLWNYVFWGSAVPSGYDSNFIKGLSGKGLQANRNKEFTTTAANNEKAYLAYPKRFGIAVMESGGFEGGFQSPVTVSFTNFSGYTEDYYLIESDQFGLGTITIRSK